MGGRGRQRADEAGSDVSSRADPILFKIFPLPRLRGASGNTDPETNTTGEGSELDIIRQKLAAS